MSSKSFKVGDKVVCIDISGIGYLHKLYRDKIYTISEVHSHGIESISVEGVEGGWYAGRFELAATTTNPCCEVPIETPTKKKCDCPLDILMNEGCKCGGD